VPAPSRPQPGGVVFLDRDGVVNTLPKYSTGPSEMKIVPGAGLAIARLQMRGLRVVIVSSQSCIGRGYVATSTVHAVMDRCFLHACTRRRFPRKHARIQFVHCACANICGIPYLHPAPLLMGPTQHPACAHSQDKTILTS